MPDADFYAFLSDKLHIICFGIEKLCDLKKSGRFAGIFHLTAGRERD